LNLKGIEMRCFMAIKREGNKGPFLADVHSHIHSESPTNYARQSRHDSAVIIFRRRWAHWVVKGSVAAVDVIVQRVYP
jgi:hypothetical protein